MYFILDEVGHIVFLTKKCIFTAMKRFLAFILLLVYSVTSIGATVQLHYCMGKLSVATPLVVDDTLTYALPKIEELHPQNNAPPRGSGVDVYIRNCVFRI